MVLHAEELREIRGQIGAERLGCEVEDAGQSLDDGGKIGGMVALAGVVSEEFVRACLRRGEHVRGIRFDEEAVAGDAAEGLAHGLLAGVKEVTGE
jgi:hypothetical protein